MVELIVTDSDEPQSDEVNERVAVCDPSDVESALRTQGDIWYGPHFHLRGDGIDMAAICTTNGYLHPGEACRFLLYDGGNLIDEQATRDDEPNTNQTQAGQRQLTPNERRYVDSFAAKSRLLFSILVVIYIPCAIFCVGSLMYFAVGLGRQAALTGWAVFK